MSNPKLEALVDATNVLSQTLRLMTLQRQDPYHAVYTGSWKMCLMKLEEESHKTATALEHYLDSLEPQAAPTKPSIDDTERLNWLISQLDSRTAPVIRCICHTSSGDNCFLRWTDQLDGIIEQIGLYPTARDAIDAAIREEKKQEEEGYKK